MDAPSSVKREPAGNNSDIVRIAREIWRGVLMLPLEAADERISLNGVSSVSACIQLTGDWRGAVTLQCSTRLARRIAQTMFDMAEPDVTAGEVCDAVGEVANMLGGNFKSVLQVSCQISLPSVAEGTNYTLVVPHAEVLSCTTFRCEGEPLLVLVHRFVPPEARQRGSGAHRFT